VRPEITRSIRNTVGDGLRRSARRDPAKTALVFENRSWTFAELDAAVNRAAKALLERDLQKATGSPRTGRTPTRTSSCGSPARGPA
jgi:fatty-acyl-CoA synthase